VIGLFEQVLDRVGPAICAGTAPAVLTAQDIEESTGASRSVVREAARVLETLGMVRPVKRVGLVVQAPEHWNVLDPRVIRWNLASPGHDEQVRELLELRIAIEPEAARLAAVQAGDWRAGQANGGADPHAADDPRAQLVEAAKRLVGASGTPAFGERDAEFHRAVLEASGNAMFVRLAGVISEALRERASTVAHADPRDVTLHAELAERILAGAADAAADTAREIITRTAADTARTRNSEESRASGRSA